MAIVAPICGAHLSSPSKEYLEPLLRRQIQDLLKEQLKDQRTVEIETSVAIASRLSEWAKLFGLFAGIPLAILVLTLAVLGIKSYTDLSTSIDSRKTSIQESLKQANEQVSALNNKGRELMAEYQKQEKNLQLVANLSDDIKNIDNKVDTLAKKVGVTFTPSSALEPAQANTILTALKTFQAYLRSVGFMLQAEEVAVDVEPGPTTARGNAVAYYDEDRRTIHVAKPFASNSDEIVSVYTETKMGVVPIKSSDPTLSWVYSHIGRGLAEYLWCSFKESPRFGTPGNLYDFENAPDFTGVKPYYEETNTAIWAGAFWELRQMLGKTTADKLLVATWNKLKVSQPRDANAPSFVEELTVTDHALNGGSHVRLIQGGIRAAKTGLVSTA